jgi:hypothetical protein
MTLVRKPRRPRFVPYISYSNFARALKVTEWQPYLAPFAPRGDA